MAEVGLLPFARIALQVSKAVLPRCRRRFSKHQFTQPQLSTARSERRCAGCGARAEKDGGAPAWRSMRRAWRREPSAPSSCGGCIITGKNRCRGGTG